MKLAITNAYAFFFVVLFSTPAFAVPVSWTDWISNTDNSAFGQLTVGTTVVDVNYSNTTDHAFVQTGTGINYWSESSPAPYTSGTVDNAPTPSEQIALDGAGTVTISFSETIINPYIAMNSWNGNTVDFLGTSISIDSSGYGYWGSGTATLNASDTGFSGSGEFHGVILLSGVYDSISFTHTGENWHGFTIGVTGLDGPANPVPEPTTLILFGTGLAGLIGVSRRRKKK